MTAKRLFVGRKTCEDRFTIITDYENEIGVKENRSGDVVVLKHSDLNAQQFVAQLVVFLNDQNQAIVDLYDGSKYWSDKATEKIKELEKENEQLKKQLDETIEGLHKEITTSENAFEGLMNENKELRDACKNYDWYKLYNQLLNENEQLKTTIQQLRTDNTKQKKKLNTTMKENEHIKQTIKDMINTERTELGKMTLRQLWRQIQ